MREVRDMKASVKGLLDEPPKQEQAPAAKPAATETDAPADAAKREQAGQ